MMKRRESFIVYLVVDDEPKEDIIAGNIEHVRTGWIGTFSSQEELVRILTEALHDLRGRKSIKEK